MFLSGTIKEKFIIISIGHNSTCACMPGAFGYNCGGLSGDYYFVVGLAGGIIAAIVIVVVLCAALVAGSASA
jgi:hypothetical protein